MGSSERDSGVVHFADCTLDLRTAELCRNGTKLILQDQPFRILAALLESPGQLVAREELIKKLWPNGTFVDFDQSLNKAIARLRDALGDSAEKPVIVETLPRKGYRFIASLEATEPTKLDPPAAPPFVYPTSHSLPWRWALAVGVALTLLVLVVKFWLRPHKVALARSVTVAVLPFQNTGSDKDLDFLRFALPDEIATTLSYAPSVAVRPSSMAVKYVGQNVDLQKVGREMRVAEIVTGHFLKQEDRLQVVMEAVEVQSNRVIWHDTLTASNPDLIAMRSEITRKVRAGLLPTLGVSTVLGPVTNPIDESAYDSYLRSIPVSRDPGPNAAAIVLLQSSVDADPNFAPAWEALGRRYNYAAEFGGGGDEMRDRSDDALSRALRLDPNLIVATGELITHHPERRELGKAYDLARKFVTSHQDSAQAHYVLGYVYRYAGMLTLSASECDTALALDPGNSDFRTCAWTFTELGRSERARDFFALDAGSDWAAYAEVTVLMGEGQTERAHKVLQTISSNPHHFRDLLEVCLRDRAAPDLDRFARESVATLRVPIDPEVLYYQGAILVFCGRQEQGVQLLSHAISGNYCAKTALQTDPLLKNLRGTPQHGQLLTSAAQCEQRLLAKTATK